MKWISIGVALALSATGAAARPNGGPAGPGTAATVPSAIPAPASGKGQVIFFRKGGLMGAAISCAVHENGAKLSSLPPGKFAALDVSPGAHDFSVQSEATNTLHLDVTRGQTYYAQCTVGMGLMAGHPHLKLTEAADFEKMQAKLKPVVPKS